MEGIEGGVSAMSTLYVQGNISIVLIAYFKIIVSSSHACLYSSGGYNGGAAATDMSLI